jgi:acetolactate synthase I/II/III large subunit
VKMRLADYLIRNFSLIGVNDYFVLTGRGILYLTDALAANKDVNKVFLHHEQACAYAACGYTDVSLKPSICMVSTGCGSTNAISGVLNAWQDNLPVIFISGQNKLNETSYHTGKKIRTYGNQEANIIDLIKPITKYSVMVQDIKEINNIIKKAFIEATTNRKGPVWIDIPLDVQNQFVDLEDIDFNIATKDVIIDMNLIDEVIRNLKGAEKPLVLIGSGIRDANVIEKFIQFIEDNNIPFVFTPSAVDIIDSNHELSIGSVGMLGGTAAGNIVLQNSDLLIVLGSRLSSVTTGDDVNDFARNAKIFVVDIDLEEHTKTSNRYELIINIDLKDFFYAISDLRYFNKREKWFDFIKITKNKYTMKSLFINENNIDLHHFSFLVTQSSLDQEHFVVDSGLNEIIFPAVGSFSNYRRCIHPYSQGSMGYALPASIGAHIASGSKVYAIIGDGSVMLNIQELQTISVHRYPIVIFIINNENYSIIRTRQQELFRNRTIGTDITNGVSTPDFREIAKAFNIRYLSIKSKSEINTIKSVIKFDGPLIVEVFTDPNQKYLKPGIIRDEQGKIRPTKLDELHIII